MSVGAASPWPVLCIMGPTAVGKSALSLDLADRLPCDLVSVDSAAVYREMDLGTAKPSVAERARHPHALVDVRDPADAYSAADFRRDALAAMATARAAGRVPVLVGGTMLYFRVLAQGIADMPAADPAIRRHFAAREKAEGLPALAAELAEIDPIAAARIDPRNAQRVKRALEVHAVSGEPISAFWARQADGTSALSGYAPIWLALLPDDRVRLHAIIGQRFNAMLAAGLVDEVRALRARGDLSPDLPSIRAVGYRQVWAHLEGEYGAEEMREKALAATRQLARRQLTWLRRWPKAEYIELKAGGRPPAALAAGLGVRLRELGARALS